MNAAIEGFRAKAQAAMEAGNAAEAASLLGNAANAQPADAELWNSAAGASLRAGNPEEAVERYMRARALAPKSVDFAVNHAIALGRVGRHRTALAALAECEDEGVRDARYCSTRANAARNAGLHGEAARWYDHVLALDPDHPRARHGRARVALERAEPDALARFEHALTLDPGNPESWLGKAQALDVAGQAMEAKMIAQALADRAPNWTEALRFLAQLLLAEGDEDFAAPYATAAMRSPDDPAIPIAHCAVLAALDRSAEAAEVAAEARLRFPNMARLAMLEASHAGEAGDDRRAEAIWASLKHQTGERALHEARHRLRVGQPDRAESLLASHLEDDAGSVAGWALRGLAWRMLDDPRHEWLHAQEGLVQFLPLRGADNLLARATSELHRIHDGSALPLGQSLRGGTQTRGGLFDRYEPIWSELEAAVFASLADYREKLAAEDREHPLLRHRDARWTFAGSWSVRLAGGGDHHTSHIHPQGIVSSALYLDLPEDIEGEGKVGWLEIGRPPADLRLDLPPIHTIQPREGYLALFPSTLYHGTTPFAGSHRLTMAFDVQAAEEVAS